MFPQFFSVPTLAAIAVAATAIAAAGPSEARDWLRSVERHYEAAEETKYVPRGGNPQWDFDLNTVVNDMEWRARTAAMLRDLPKPNSKRRDADSGQLADREAPPRLQFRF